MEAMRQAGARRLLFDRNLSRCLSITHAGLAASMLTALGGPATIRRQVCVAN